jgi:hypothetical protein
LVCDPLNRTYNPARGLKKDSKEATIYKAEIKKAYEGLMDGRFIY